MQQHIDLESECKCVLLIEIITGKRFLDGLIDRLLKQALRTFGCHCFTLPLAGDGMINCATRHFVRSFQIGIVVRSMVVVMFIFVAALCLSVGNGYTWRVLRQSQALKH